MIFDFYYLIQIDIKLISYSIQKWFWLYWIKIKVIY